MPKRTLEGRVVSNKMNKTLVVQVDRKVNHPLYKKFIIKSKKYHAHTERDDISLGDKVTIKEHKPISKLKRWVVL